VVEVAAASHAIHAVQHQVLGKILQAEKSLERRCLHVLRIGKAHVIFDERENLAGFVVGETEAAADFGRDGHAHVHVTVEANAVGPHEGRRLAHIMPAARPMRE